MIFVIAYDRAAGKIESLREFSDADRASADAYRLALERESARPDLAALGGLGAGFFDREIVALEAPSREALLVTHRRYFVADLLELAKPSAA
jgi:hypothetical protein